MFIPFITTLILYLIIISYVTTNTSDTIGKIKIAEMAARTTFSKEKILYTSISKYIENNGVLPTDVQSLKDDNYLNSNFDNSTSNFIFSLSNNNTTLIICSNYELDDDIYKNFYLKHYMLREYGYSPYVDSTNTRDVCHPFPLRLETIDKL